MAENNDTSQGTAGEAKPQAQSEAAQPKAKKVFTRADVRRTVPIRLHFPDLYPNMEPFGFKLRLKLSGDAEERRQEYLSLAATEQTVKETEQNLDELCDLVTEVPTGFGDLQDNGKGPGESFKEYVMTADPVTKDFLFNVVKGAISLYWRKTSPFEFRK